jgi:hypothetical protein
MKAIIIQSILVLLFLNCAALHQHHVGDIDNTVKQKEKFIILRSQFGLAVGDANLLVTGANSSGAMSNNDYDSFQIIKTIFELSNMGPRTGARVFSDTYTDKLLDEIYKKCPSGNITELASTRETAVYPVISGEIIKITGYCVETKK